MRMDKYQCSYIDGLSEYVVTNSQDCINLLIRGIQSRKQRKTTHNNTSSRSHAIFRLQLEKTINGALLTCKLNLCDLAGSEKPSPYECLNETHISEMKHINSSLSTLSCVIQCLAKKSKFVPYRDSVLTRYLQDCIGGNSRSILVATVNGQFPDETISTLRFADCAKKIKVNSLRNQPINDNTYIDKLRREVSYLRDIVKRSKQCVISKQLIELEKENKQLINCKDELDGLRKENKNLKLEIQKFASIQQLAITQDDDDNKVKSTMEECSDTSNLTHYSNQTQNVFLTELANKRLAITPQKNKCTHTPSIDTEQISEPVIKPIEIKENAMPNYATEQPKFKESEHTKKEIVTENTSEKNGHTMSDKSQCKSAQAKPIRLASINAHPINARELIRQKKIKIESISAMSVPEIDSYLNKLKWEELEESSQKLKENLKQGGRCPKCTLKIPCKHYNSISEVVQEAAAHEKPEQHSVNNELILTAYNDSKIIANKVYKRRIVPNSGKYADIRFRGKDNSQIKVKGSLNRSYYEQKKSVSMVSDIETVKKKLKVLEDIERYREDKIKKQLEAIEDSKIKEEEDRKKERAKEEAYKKYIEQQKQRLKEYKEKNNSEQRSHKENKTKQKQLTILVKQREKRKRSTQKQKISEFNQKKQMLLSLMQETSFLDETPLNNLENQSNPYQMYINEQQQSNKVSHLKGGYFYYEPRKY